MSQITTAKKVKQEDAVTKAIDEIVEQLKIAVQENSIKKIITEAWVRFEADVSNENTFNRKVRTPLRKAIEVAFPFKSEPTPGYYKTASGKGKAVRWEHLALWYATTKKERWQVVGDDARAKYFKELPPLEESTTLAPEASEKIQLPEQAEPQPQAEVKSAVLELEDMTVENLKLDSETQQIVRDALAQSGMSLAEFIKQACRVYAKTVTGKTRKHSEDLSVIDTETLRKDKAYSTHPGRAEELVKRAIQALKSVNGQATELSQKWLITQSLLVDMTGAKALAVKSAMSKFQAEIDSYNRILTEAGATSLLNRKGELKEDFCEEWVRRFPSAIN